MDFGQGKEISHQDMILDELFFFFFSMDQAEEFDKTFKTKDQVPASWDDYMGWCLPSIVDGKLKITFDTSSIYDED